MPCAGLAWHASTKAQERSRSPQSRACPGMPGSKSASPASRARCSDTLTHVRPGAAKGAMLACMRHQRHPASPERVLRDDPDEARGGQQLRVRRRRVVQDCLRPAGACLLCFCARYLCLRCRGPQRSTHGGAPCNARHSPWTAQTRAASAPPARAPPGPAGTPNSVAHARAAAPL